MKTTATYPFSTKRESSCARRSAISAGIGRPTCPGTGVWQGVSLYGENKYRMRDIAFFTRRDGSVRAEITWSFSDYFDERAKDDEAVLEIFGDESLTLPVLGCKDKLCGKKSVLNFHIPNVRLWWPNGYGKQEFYYARVRLMREGKALDTAVRRFAVREIELDQSAYDARSNLCRLKVNGAPCSQRAPTGCPPTVSRARWMRTATKRSWNLRGGQTSICCACGAAAITKRKFFTTNATKRAS